MRNLLLLSNSTLHGTEYLQYAEENIKSFLKNFSVTSVLFVPYALSDHDRYEEKVASAFKRLGLCGVLGLDVTSIHRQADALKAVAQAQAIYVGGGNTFRLLNQLYCHQLIEPIRNRVLLDGVPYMGASAGSNVATVSICTSNDMPIVHPPSFRALALVPFNINPHYLDTDPASTHMGETREARIREYHEEEGVPAVVALREGSLLQVTGDTVTLHGLRKARIFYPEKEAEEYDVGADLSFLLDN